MASGGIRRFAVAAGALLAAGLSAGFTSVAKTGTPAPPPRRNAHHADRLDINLGRWSYKRKGLRTATRQKRAARKKRNRARNK